MTESVSIKRRKIAAGCMPMCTNTGRVLLLLRCAHVDKPRTWSTIGGSLEPAETPRAAVMREVAEETGYDGSIKLVEMHVHSTPVLFYTSFIGLVPDEFHPHLNWEHDDALWCDLTDLPSPLHPGLTEMLRTKYARITDLVMKFTLAST